MNRELLTVAHGGQTSHRGGDVSNISLKEQFTWRGMATDAKDFVANCFLCVISQGRSKIPCPFSTTPHASKRNESIHFDYLFLRASEDDNKYALFIKDYFSSYTW